MRELFGSFGMKSVASCGLAAALATGLYVLSSPGRSLEAPMRVIAGHARVVDGDTLDIAGQRIRLEGIDAPEIGQRCPMRFWFGSWPAGRDATAKLRKLIAGNSVRCEWRSRDSYGRLIANCRAGVRDLNAEMVRSGHAWAFVKYSNSYIEEEQRARSARAGIWQSNCQTAWDYRAEKWSAHAEAAPSGCAIKGNITSKGRLYHMPWSPWYARTKIERAKGERWFCDEREALAAGWSPAVRNEAF